LSLAKILDTTRDVFKFLLKAGLVSFSQNKPMHFTITSYDEIPSISSIEIQTLKKSTCPQFDKEFFFFDMQKLVVNFFRCIFPSPQRSESDSFVFLLFGDISFFHQVWEAASF